jgi:Ankyrin repeats (many copies)
MVRMGKSACFMKDRHGFLPIHIACSRHCSPDKLELLLEANPASLHEITNEGHTPLSLAESTATKSHPNYTLICSLKKELARTHMAHTYKYGQTEDGILVSPGVKHSASSACMMKSLPDVPVFDARLSPIDFFVTHALMNKCSADEELMLEGPPTQAVANLLMHLSHTEAHEI